MTRFIKGQRVKATVNGQGLEAGRLYEVVEVNAQHTMFGVFVTYDVAPVGGNGVTVLPVVNGHVVFEEVV